MGYDDQKTGSSGLAPAWIIVLVVSLLAAMLVVGATGWFVLRTSQMPQLALVERERALAAEEQARAMAEKLALETELEVSRAAREFENEVVVTINDQRLVTVELDSQGQIRLDGKSIDLAGLPGRLQAIAADEGRSKITIDLRADNACPFEHVAAVIGTCRQLEISRFHIRTLESAAEQSPEKADEPATVIQ
jgi:biopolymer transport protein ExbD